MLDPRHGARVAAADRRHLDDLTFDELDTIIRSEDAGLAHAVILIEREAPALDRYRHAVLAVRHSALTSAWPSMPRMRYSGHYRVGGCVSLPALDSGSRLTQPLGPGGFGMATTETAIRELTYGEAVKEAIAEEM